MELLFGALNKREAGKIKKYINMLKIFHVDIHISEKSVGLIDLYAKSHSLSIPDAIIAATALETDFLLFTYNVKDFSFIKGLKLHLINS